MINMGWGVKKKSFLVAHVWLSKSDDMMVWTACGKRPRAFYWTIRDAEPEDARCPDCQRLESDNAPNAGGAAP